MENTASTPNESPSRYDGYNIWSRNGVLTVQHKATMRTTSVTLSDTAGATEEEILRTLIERVTAREPEPPHVSLGTTAPSRPPDTTYMGYSVWYLEEQMVAQDPHSPNHVGRIIHVDPRFYSSETVQYLREHAIIEIIRALEGWRG